MLERDLFLAAWEIDDARVRRAYLDSHCEDDPLLRQRIERLLGHAHVDSDFLEQPASDVCLDWDRGVEPQAQYGAAHMTGPLAQLNSMDSETHAVRTDVASTASLNPSRARSTGDRSEPETLFGRYRIERLLGTGGMGIVYLVEDLRLGRHVALKIPRFDTDGQLHLVERFRREARTMASVQHRHICQIFDVAEQDGQHYLTMAFINGQTLGQTLQQGVTFTMRQIASLVWKLALALDAAHRAHVVHRDLKPANVMIDHSGEPIIMDFGLAWLVHETDSRVTQSGAIIGTPAYMSPEQAAGHPNALAAPSDIYSLGTILYELLTGRPVYLGSVTDVLYQVRHETPIRPSVIRSAVDLRLDAICCKAISHDPQDRFATAGAFAEALAGVLLELQEETVSAARLAPIVATSLPGGTPMVEQSHPPQVPPQRWRRTTLSGLAGFAVLLLLATVLLLTTRYGTLEVTAPDGKLPDDIQIVVTRGGEEIELLQAENHWSAKVVHGECQVQLKSGQDRFEISNSRLTVNRLGHTVVQLEFRPADDLLQPAIAPFDDQQARAHQAAWARHLGVPVEYTNSIGMQFVLIPPGEFIMGSTDAEIAEAVQAFGSAEDQTWPDFFRSEAPQHTVHLTQPFYIGVYEVTQAEYEQVLGKDRNASCFAQGSFGSANVVGLDTMRHPVEMVSWNDATEYCAQLSQLEALQPTDIGEGDAETAPEMTGYRLPTEAQWEFACRAGTTTKYWMGTTEQDLALTGWFNLNSGGRTHAVGELQANPFGLYDMHGNVEEWVQDHYEAYPENRTVNPSVTSTTEIRRVTRGGFWTFMWPLCRSTHRFARTPDSQFNYTGFRVVLDVDAVKAAIAERAH